MTFISRIDGDESFAFPNEVDIDVILPNTAHLIGQPARLRRMQGAFATVHSRDNVDRKIINETHILQLLSESPVTLGDSKKQKH